jgi:hypothetical protein
MANFMDNRFFTISFIPLNLSIDIEFDLTQNKQLIDKLVGVMPYKSLITHTIVSGGNIYHNIPIGNDFNFCPTSYTNRINAPIGTVFMSDLQTLFIKYADISETNDYAVIGHVIDADIKKLINIGELCWNSIYNTKEIILAEVKCLGYESDKIRSDPIFNSLSKNADKKLVQLAIDMRRSLKEIWLTPPEELQLIFKGQAKRKPGTNNQFYSTLFFVTSTLQQLAALGDATLIAKIAGSNEFQLPTLKKIVKNFLASHIFEFLGYCGLESYSKDAKTFLKLVDSIESIEDFFCLSSIFAIYTNHMHLWCLHYFPWSEGKNYTYI